MPTSKPRVHVTLSPEVHATVAKLAELQSSSMSSVVAELVTEMSPVLLRVGQAIEHARKLEAEAIPAYVSSLDQAQASLEPLLVALMAQLDPSQAPAGDGVGDHARQGVGAASAPPPVPSADPRALTGGSVSRKPLKTNKPKSTPLPPPNTPQTPPSSPPRKRSA